MKIFVTGGTGFVGCHFMNQAHLAGHDIVALRHSSNTPRIPLQAKATWIEKGLQDLAPEDLEGCESVIHLAAHSANLPYDTIENCLLWNVMHAVRLFNVAIESGIRRFIVAGSCYEYGQAAERYDLIPSDAPLEPTQSYPTSKAAASVAFFGLAKEKNLQLLILRIFQVFGEGELKTRLWPSLRLAAQSGQDFPLTLGEQVRDFMPVEQVAEKFVQALTRNDLHAGQPKIENLGTGHPQTLRHFAEHWWKHWGAQGKLLFGALPYRSNEVMRYVPKLP